MYLLHGFLRHCDQGLDGRCQYQVARDGESIQLGAKMAFGLVKQRDDHLAGSG